MTKRGLLVSGVTLGTYPAVVEAQYGLEFPFFGLVEPGGQRRDYAQLKNAPTSSCPRRRSLPYTPEPARHPNG
jgi:hypothetical protein